MKKLSLLSLASAISAITVAQPTLTSTTNNPVIGDDFGFYNCFVAASVPGASGAAVTWDFHSLVKMDSGRLNIVSCASTPFCDSFPGTDIVLNFLSPGVDIEYNYCNANAGMFEIAGDYIAGSDLTHFPRPDIVLKYPVDYGTSYLDTSVSFSYTGAPPIDFVINRSVRIIDGYGTLILPSGTYANVLREHQTITMFDSLAGGAPTFSYYYETYRWFTPGFHMFLMVMDLDSSAGSGLAVTNVAYLTKNSLGLNERKSTDIPFTVSPNPAADVLNITLSIDKVQNASLTYSDISGRVVDKVVGSDLRQGENKIQYSVSSLPSGLYLLHYTDDTHSVTKKVVVSH